MDVSIFGYSANSFREGKKVTSENILPFNARQFHVFTLLSHAFASRDWHYKCTS